MLAPLVLWLPELPCCSSLGHRWRWPVRRLQLPTSPTVLGPASAERSIDELAPGEQPKTSRPRGPRVPRPRPREGRCAGGASDDLEFVSGDVTVNRVIEQEAPFFDAFEFFPTLTPEILDENRAWLQPTYFDATNRLILCIQSYLVRTPRHAILIDTCVGNHKRRPRRPFWDMMTSDRYEATLAATGLAVGDIDYVMCTHLHVDHVGWNTRLADGRWIPTFPRAMYLFATRELDYWTSRQRDDPEGCPWITDSVLPIVEAKRADLVTSDHELDDLVRLIPTPGHTIDHYSVQVGKPGSDAIITGDMIHTPLQARYPELGMFADYDTPQAARTRRDLFGRICGTPTLLCTAHFPSPSTGRIVCRGNAFDFVPARRQRSWPVRDTGGGRWGQLEGGRSPTVG